MADRTPVLDEVRRLNGNLTKLLADAQPGVLTWQQMVGQTIHDLSEAIAADDERPEPVGVVRPPNREQNYRSPMTDWDVLEANTGWELFYLDIPLVDGALDIGDAADRIEDFEHHGWELKLVGHDRNGMLQLCFRRPYGDREDRIAEMRAIRAAFEERLGSIRIDMPREPQ